MVKQYMDETRLLPPLCEDEVCEIVADWFEARGFIAKWIPAGKQGFDIEATHSVTGQRWIVEAKGATTSNRNSPAYGREYDQNGAYARVSQAYWMASRWACLNEHADVNIGIALPSTYHFDNHSRPVDNACHLLGIAVFRVHLDKTVEVFPPSLETEASKKFERPKQLLLNPKST